VGGPGLAFETWVSPRKWIPAEIPRVPKEQVCFPWEARGRDLTIPPFAKNAKDGAPVDQWWR
jgi:hypothetical protein